VSLKKKNLDYIFCYNVGFIEIDNHDYFDLLKFESKNYL